MTTTDRFHQLVDRHEAALAAGEMQTGVDVAGPAPDYTVRRIFWQTCLDRPRTHVELVLEDVHGNRHRSAVCREMLVQAFREPDDVAEMTWPAQPGADGFLCTRLPVRA